jgi:hypothetical protein
MKQTKKLKMNLKLETIKPLNGKELGAVAGGVLYTTVCRPPTKSCGVLCATSM